MATIHLWWNGYFHAPGRTAEEAEQWARDESGEADCQGDNGWSVLPDDMKMQEEDGTLCDPKETALEAACDMLRRTKLRALAKEILLAVGSDAERVPTVVEALHHAYLFGLHGDSRHPTLGKDERP